MTPTPPQSDATPQETKWQPCTHLPQYVRRTWFLLHPGRHMEALPPGEMPPETYGVHNQCLRCGEQWESR